MKTIYLPQQEFVQLDKIVSVENIARGTIAGTFFHDGSEYVVTGSIGTGKGGTEKYWATEITDIRNYPAEKKPVTYHYHQGGKGYYNMKVKFRNRTVVFLKNEIEVKKQQVKKDIAIGKKRSMSQVQELLRFPGQLVNQISFMQDQVARTWERYLSTHGRDEIKFYLGIHNITKEILTSLQAFQEGCNDKSLHVGSKRSPGPDIQLGAPWSSGFPRMLDDPDPQEQGPAVRCKYSGCLKYFFQHNKKRAFCSSACRIAHHRQNK